MRSIWVLIYLEDKSRCIGGILNNAVLSLVVKVCSIEIVLVYALNAGKSQSWDHIHDSCIVSWVESPLNSFFIRYYFFKIVYCLVKVTSCRRTQLFLCIEHLYVPLKSVYCSQILLSLRIFSKYRQRSLPHIQHCLSIINKFMDIEKS